MVQHQQAQEEQDKSESDWEKISETDTQESLDTTMDSSEEKPRKVALFSSYSPALFMNEDAMESASDSEDIAISPRSVGIDFVWKAQNILSDIIKLTI